MIDDKCIPLGERDEWKDVTPIEQNDGPNALVPIMYTEAYRNQMDYFRAVSAAEEKSERVLALTEAIIRINPAHYTVWQYRFATLLALQKDLLAELELMNEFARENLKSYQVWHHRLLLLTHVSPEDPTTEISFIHNALQPDPKNYHTWAYLHWLYCHFSALDRISADRWSAELQWCEMMLEQDGRNNSAWGWRWFLRMGRPDAEGAKEGGKSEIEYALRQIHHIPHNVSAWNYLRGIVRSTSTSRVGLLPSLLPYIKGAAVPLPEAKTKLSWPEREGEVVDTLTPLPVPHALEFYADALVEAGRLGEAAAVFGQLAGEVDQMRVAYWDMRKAECVNA